MIILASQSPRRQELLKYITTEFEIRVSDVDEALPDGISPSDAVLYLSNIKAQPFANGDDIVIGADTVVALDGKILGKPKDRAEARDMLNTLSGCTHSVFSGVAVICDGKEYTGYEETKVTMREITDSEKDAYLRSGEGDDKAGAYGIQGMACAFIEKIDGSYHNVMGLPVFTLCKLLEKAGEELIK